MNWISIGSDNGLSPGRHQATIWTNADILSIRPERIYFNEILFKGQISLFKKMCLNMSSAKWQPFCPGADELKHAGTLTYPSIKQANRICNYELACIHIKIHPKSEFFIFPPKCCLCQYAWPKFHIPWNTRDNWGYFLLNWKESNYHRQMLFSGKKDAWNF